MATYYVFSGAAGTNAGTSWTNAYTAFASAVTAATTAGDIILVHKTHQENLGANTTYTFLADVLVVSVDKDASDALAAMGEGGWIGSASAARTVTLNGAFKVLLYGMTFRGHGASLTTNNTDGGQFALEFCKFWITNTGASGNVIFGAANINCWTRLLNCEIKHARTTNGSWSTLVGGRLEMLGGSIIAASTSTAAVFAEVGSSNAGTNILCQGVDMSGIAASQTLVGSMARAYTEVRFIQCKLPATAARMATQTPANLSSAHVWLHDCDTGDTHGIFEYRNALGSIETNSSIYYATGAAGQSWKVTTTSNASYSSPFCTPWIDWYNTGTSAITPRLEILRDGSATAYTEAEVWAEFTTKTEAGSVLSTVTSTRQALADRVAGTTASDVAAGAGLGSWTGESGTAWAGKLQSASVTPDEVGYLRARVCVGLASVSGSLYVDPQIRT